MRGKIALWCLLATVAFMAGNAMAADTFMEFIGAAGTSNYNLAGNWQELVKDPNSGLLIWGTANRVPDNNDANSKNEMAFMRNGVVVTLANTVANISGFEVGTGGDITKDANGYVQPRSPTTFNILPSGSLTVRSCGGTASPETTRVGGNYDGTLNINGGYLEVASGTGFVVGGTATRDPNGVHIQGKGYLNITSGQLNADGYSVYIGSGWTRDTSGNRVEGTANISGGAAYADLWYIGNGGATGRMVVTSDPNSPTVVGGAQTSGAGFYLGVDGNYWYRDYDPSGRSYGSYVQSGGSVAVGSFNVGRNHGTGDFTLNGGTFTVWSSSESRIGMGGIYTGGTAVFPKSTGIATVTINDGFFETRTSSTKVILGRGQDGGGAGYGTFIVNGGYAGFFRDAAGHTLELGNVTDTNSVGVLEVLGGTVWIDQYLTLAKNDGCTAVLKLGKNGYMYVGAMKYGGNEATGQTDVETTIIELGSNGSHGVIDVAGGTSLYLRGTQHTETGSFRPKEGDKYDSIINFQNGTSIDSSLGYDNFQVFTSNITNGLQQDPNDPNQTLTAFKADWVGTEGDPNYAVQDPNYIYPGFRLTFQGLTYGDANGSHAVNSGDLSLLTGSWGETSGNTWADGDFNGDGAVNSGDLSLLTGTWGWTLPSPAPGAIPEPATLALLGLGGLTLIRRKR